MCKFCNPAERDTDIRDDPYYEAQRRQQREDARTAKRLNDGFAALNSEGILPDEDDDSADE